MKLFAIIALVAFAGCVAAEIIEDDDFSDEEYSESAMPTDEREVSNLPEDQRIFSSLCTTTRDDVEKFLKDSANEAASKLYTIFFQSAAESAENILRVQHSTVEEAEKLILENAQPVEYAPANKQEAKQALAQTAESISLIQTLSRQVKFVLSSVADTIKSEFMARLALLKSEFQNVNMKDQISFVCRKITGDLTDSIKSSMNNFKSEARRSMATNPSQKALLATIQSAEMDKVKCLTMSRVVTASKVCGVFTLAGPMILSIIGL